MYNRHNLLNFLKNKELNELYLSVSIRAFAVSMSGIFIPIYLYQLGYSFKSIFIFLGILSIVHALFSFPAAKISSKLGLKYSMLLSVPLLIAFFVLLYSLDEYHWPLSILGLVLGISTSLFWIAYHVDFSKFSDKQGRGMQVGFSKIFISIFAVLGPLIGGFILMYFGFKILFIIVFIFLIGSTIPLFLSKEIHEPFSSSLKNFFKSSKIKDILGFLGHGVELRLEGCIWPLFIFIFILNEKYLSLGFASTLVFSTSLIFTFFVGKLSIPKKRRIILRIGSLISSGIWVIKSFIITPLQVFIIDSFYGANQAITNVPFDAMNYDKGKKRNNIVGMIVQREFYIHLGACLISIIVAFAFEHIVYAFRYGGPLASLLRFLF